MSTRTGNSRSGFNLVELMIVVVVVGIVAAIAIPRVSRGARGTNDTALRSNLAILRGAIELYASEHNGIFPGATAAGGRFGAAGSADAFRSQLLRYTDAQGNVSEKKDATHVYGPYLRDHVPALPVGANGGNCDLTVRDTAPVPGGATGWVYCYKTGMIIANCSDIEKDELDTSFNRY